MESTSQSGNVMPSKYSDLEAIPTSYRRPTTSLLTKLWLRLLTLRIVDVDTHAAIHDLNSIAAGRASEAQRGGDIPTGVLSRRL